MSNPSIIRSRAYSCVCPRIHSPSFNSSKEYLHTTETSWTHPGLVWSTATSRTRSTITRQTAPNVGVGDQLYVYHRQASKLYRRYANAT